MKPVMLIAAVATLSSPAFAQNRSVSQPVWNAAAQRALDDQAADNAAAADIARIRPVSETVMMTDIPASQPNPVTPTPSVTAAAPDHIGG
jgi:hypothetical protein